MIYPHTIENGEIKKVNAWIVCDKCNDSRHHILPGEKTPYWWCQDEKKELKPNQEIEVEYLEGE